MARNTYSLLKGAGTVEISWLGIFYEGGKLVVTLNEDDLGIIPSLDELSRGQEFKMPDGSFIKAQLTCDSLQVFQDDNILPCIEDSFIIPGKTNTSAGRETQNEKTVSEMKAVYASRHSGALGPTVELFKFIKAYRTVLFTGYALITIGVLSMLSEFFYDIFMYLVPGFLLAFLVGKATCLALTLVFGIAFVALGYAIRNRHSGPLKAAIALFGLHALSFLYIIIVAITSGEIVILIVYLLILVAIASIYFRLTIKGIRAIDTLNSHSMYFKSGKSEQG
jgi:hypothetical protein